MLHHEPILGIPPAETSRRLGEFHHSPEGFKTAPEPRAVEGNTSGRAKSTIIS